MDQDCDWTKTGARLEQVRPRLDKDWIKTGPRLEKTVAGLKHILEIYKIYFTDAQHFKDMTDMMYFAFGISFYLL